MKKNLFILFSLFFCGILNAFQFTVNVNQVPNYANAADNIYLAGTFNSWDPANANYLMTNQGNGNYSIVFEVSGAIAFKFTKGSFLMVEKDANCQEMSDRTYTVNADMTVTLQVANWRDYCDGQSQHTAASNVSVLSENFSIPQLNTSRKIWIYLPPDYSSSIKDYPVIYMQDGQNIFDAFYSFSGEWEVDESMNLLFNQGDYGAIVVGIDNGGASRIDEYSPWVNATYGGGDGDLYMEFIVNTLKPYIDANFRTKSDRQNSALIGSSMGALISFYGGIEYQNVFSKLGIFSPSFWFSNQVYTHVTQNPREDGTRIYFVAGSGESAGMVPDINQMVSTLINAQFEENQINTVIKADGQHSEWFWKREFHAAYQWLFQESSLGQKKNELNELVTLKRTSNFLAIESEQFFDLKMIDYQGKELLYLNKKSNTEIDLDNFQKGVYFLKFTFENEVITKVILN
jgi:predicted alpha/beta superfamily hydrolase